MHAWVRCAWRCGGARGVEPPEYFYTYLWVRFNGIPRFLEA